MDKLELNSLNSNESVSKGQKLQSTVRFESSQYQEVERVRKSCGVSFAEAVRRLVNEGLEALGGHQR